MSSTESTVALGSRDNWWGEPDVDDLAETPIGDLSTDQLRRYIRESTSWNIDVNRMDETSLRSYARKIRDGGHDTMGSVTAQEQAEWVAHNILRQAADKLSGTALHAPPNRGWKPAFCHVFQHLDGVEPITDHDPLATHTERCRVELTEPIEYAPKTKEKHSRCIEYGQYRHRKRVDTEHGYEGNVQLDDLPKRKFLSIVEIVLQRVKENHDFRDRRIEEWFAYAKTLKEEPGMSDEDVLAELLVEIFESDTFTR